MVKPVSEYGELQCPACGAVIMCDEYGDMPDNYKGCHEEIDYTDCEY